MRPGPAHQEGSATGLRPPRPCLPAGVTLVLTDYETWQDILLAWPVASKALTSGDAEDQVTTSQLGQPLE